MTRSVVLVAISALIASLSSLAQEVTVLNAGEFEYEVRVDTPDETEPQFKRLHLEFPGIIDQFEYAYSSIVFAQKGKRILSYRPDAYETPGFTFRRDLYVLAHEKILACMSFVSVYLDRSQGEIHSPSRSVAVNLVSFVPDAPQTCEGTVDAANFF